MGANFSPTGKIPSLEMVRGRDAILAPKPEVTQLYQPIDIRQMLR